MSEKIKFSFKELRKPDRFREILAEGVEQAADHFNKILYITAALVVLLIVMYVVSSINKGKDLQANIAFKKAITTYNNGQILDSLEMFKDVSDKFNGRKISAISTYYIGIINYDISEYELSIEQLNKFLEQNIKDDILRESAILTIGLSYFNLLNYDETIRNLSKITDSTSPYYDQIRLHLGMAYEKSGNIEKSEEIYKELLYKRTNEPPFIQ